MNINLHDNKKHLVFAPLTLTKPVAKLLMGCMTFEDRWRKYFPDAQIGYDTEEYLSNKFPLLDNAISIAANVIPNAELIEIIKKGVEGKYFSGEEWIATIGQSTQQFPLESEPVIIRERWDLFKLNAEVIKSDFSLLVQHTKRSEPSDTNLIIGKPVNVFIEDGATVEGTTLNCKEGPIYISKNAEIMEGSNIRGPFFLDEHGVVKMGAKIYGATSIGKHAKVGGEIGNSVIQSYSNKGHDGYLGNSLIGEWCNMGADSNTSNLKNNYGQVRTFSYEKMQEVQTQEQFMGLTMGDHSKCGINTMFNTATVVGVSCNIFGGDFPKKWVPSFSWGGQTWEEYKFDLAIQSANNMMSRRKLNLDEDEIGILRNLFDRL